MGLNKMPPWTHIVHANVMTPSIALNTVAADKNFEDITLDNGILENPLIDQIQHMYLELSCSKIYNSNGVTPSKTDGEQFIQIYEGNLLTWYDAIKIPDNSFEAAASEKRAGFRIMGNIDLKDVILASAPLPGSWPVMWEAAKADAATLTFYDLQIRMILILR